MQHIYVQVLFLSLIKICFNFFVPEQLKQSCQSYHRYQHIFIKRRNISKLNQRQSQSAGELSAQLNLIITTIDFERKLDNQILHEALTLLRSSLHTSNDPLALAQLTFHVEIQVSKPPIHEKLISLEVYFRWYWSKAHWHPKFWPNYSF